MIQNTRRISAFAFTLLAATATGPHLLGANDWQNPEKPPAREAGVTVDAENYAVIRRVVEELNLEYPGLDEVRRAAGEGDWGAATSALATHLRQRGFPRWESDQPGLAASEAVFPAWWPGWAPGDLSKREIHLRVAEHAVENRITVLTTQYDFGPRFDWKVNPTADPEASLALNREWTWQLNRQYFWPSLAEAYRATGDERYAEAFARQLRDWVAANSPPPEERGGDRYVWRTIEAGVRAGNTWPRAWHAFLQSPAFDDAALTEMVWSLVEHARFLRAHPSGGGNWLMIEMNGLYHVGALLPEMKEAEGWRDFAARRMSQELGTQIYPDGAQFELSPSYHDVVLRQVQYVTRLAFLNDYELPEGWMRRLEEMYACMMWLMTPDGGVPPFNDGVTRDVRERLATGAGLFPHRADFLWVASKGREGEPPAMTSYAFDHAGYVIQRSGWDEEARYLAFDAGPFGAGHQHEDKLNFILTAYGRELVVEAGKYAYERSKWRKYALGPHAHNVGFVDGLGQHRRGVRSTFVVSEPLPYTWRSTQQYDYVRATYGGDEEGWGPERLSLASQIRHVLFVKEGQGRDFWIVADFFDPADDEESHLYETVFHLNTPAVVIDERNQAITTRTPGGANLGIFPLPADRLGLEIVTAQETPFVQGWISRPENEGGMEPAPTAVYGMQGPGPQKMLYVFYPVADARVPPVSLTGWRPEGIRPGDAGAEIRFADGRIYRVLFASDGEARTIEGSEFDGGVVLR